MMHYWHKKHMVFKSFCYLRKDIYTTQNEIETLYIVSARYGSHNNRM